MFLSQLLNVGFFFQEDCTLENAWNMGGLSILTSAPPTPPSVCFLCASKGQHEVTAPHICFIFIECVKFKIQECFFIILIADAVLPSMLWALPRVLPRSSGPSLWREQGKLVLSSLQVLPRVRQEKQALKGTACHLNMFYCFTVHLGVNVAQSGSLTLPCLLPQPLLECERCQNCFHTSCLGPNYPKQNKKRKAWVGFIFLQKSQSSMFSISMLEFIDGSS